LSASTPNGANDTQQGVASAVTRAADAGATDVRTPNPSAATATSAMRLKVVFVDIFFLSISRLSDVPKAGFGQKMLSHMS
jgi:hypothetical protein